MKVVNYNRVSSKDQNLDRQCEAFEKFALENDITDYLVYSDKQSGKDFERKGYQDMLDNLECGDLVVIKSIDRLGRDYDLIIQEWTRITKTIGADIVVLDMPLLDTREKKNNLTGKFISDIVLQLLSYVAETERTNIKARQKEGIAIARQFNRYQGKPQMKIDKERFLKVCAEWRKGNKTATQCMKELDLKPNTFYRRVKEWNV